MLALAGAHRSGKSTLAKTIAYVAKGVTYVPSQTTSVFKSLGLDISKPLTFDQRMLAQEAILDLHLHDVQHAPTPWIACRSTLDFAAYAMAEWGKNAPPEGEDRLLGYVDKCLKAASWTYTGIILVQPGIPYVEEEGKAPPSKTFQELMNTLCFSYMRDSRVNCSSWFLRRELTGLEERVQAVSNIWNHIIEELPKPGEVTFN